MTAGPRFAQCGQVGRLLVVVVVGHRDEEFVLQPGALKEQRLDGPCRASVAIEKRVHRADVVVERQRLDQLIMAAKLPFERIAQPSKGNLAFAPPFDASVARRAERDVVSGRPRLAGRTMIVVASRDDAAMNLPKQIEGDRTIMWQLRDPTVGIDRRAGLPLRPREGRLRSFLAERSIEFLVRELGALDSRSAGRLLLEFYLLERLRPRALIGYGRQRHDGGLGISEFVYEGANIISQPLLGNPIGNGHISCSFPIHFHSIPY